MQSGENKSIKLKLEVWSLSKIFINQVCSHSITETKQIMKSGCKIFYKYNWAY